MIETRVEYADKRRGMPAFIEARILEVKRKRLKTKLDMSRDPLFLKREILKAKLSRI